MAFAPVYGMLTTGVPVTVEVLGVKAKSVPVVPVQVILPVPKAIVRAPVLEIKLLQ